jgi:transposase
MGKAYSGDLRDRVVAAMAAGRSCREVGTAFDVAPSTAGNWYRRYRRESSYAARPMGAPSCWSKRVGSASDWPRRRS